jgi:hypothetical protein
VARHPEDAPAATAGARRQGRAQSRKADFARHDTALLPTCTLDEDGHAVVGWALGLRVTVSRVFHDDAKGWKGGTDIADAGHLTLTEQIAIYAAGYTAEQVFKCPAHKLAAFDDHAKIYLLLKGGRNF